MEPRRTPNKNRTGQRQSKENLGNQQPEVEPIENSAPCDREYVLQENFKSNTCGCTRLFNGKPCSEEIELEKVINYRLSCLEKS
jgi:hypothetical protein